MPEITLSPARPEDREALLRLHKEARYETDLPLHPGYAQATIDCGYYEKMWHTDFLNDKSVIKAEIDGRLAGFCRFGDCAPNILRFPSEYPDEHIAPYKQGLAELDQIYVHRDFRGQFGAGQALYNAAQAQLRKDGFRHILIAMYVINRAARAFYEKRGAFHLFTETHNVTRAGKTFHNEVAVYMHKGI